jgi:hypothetical protein
MANADIGSSTGCMVLSVGSFWGDDPDKFRADRNLLAIGTQAHVNHTTSIFGGGGNGGDGDDGTAYAATGGSKRSVPHNPHHRVADSNEPPSPLPRSALLPGLWGVKGFGKQYFSASAATIYIGLRAVANAEQLAAEAVLFAAINRHVLGNTDNTVTVPGPPNNQSQPLHSGTASERRGASVGGGGGGRVVHYVRYVDDRHGPLQQNLVIFIYLLVFVYIYLTVWSMKSVKSKYGLGFAAVASVFASMAMA